MTNAAEAPGEGGEGLDPSRLLAGFRAIDLSTSFAMGWCGRLLAEAGVDVLQIEPREGHPLRGTPGEVALAGKRAVAVALGESRGRRYVLEVLRQSDIVLASEPREALEARGFALASMLQRQPRLVLVSCSEDRPEGEARYLGARASGVVASALVARERGRMPFIAWLEPADLGAADLAWAPAPEATARLPRVGEHSFDVLRTLANVTDDHLLFLFENGVIGPRD